MIDSDELKRKLAILNGLKRIKSYWIHKLHKYGDEFDKIIFDVECNPNILNEERFLKKVRVYESQIIIYKNALEQEEKSPGFFENSRTQVLAVTSKLVRRGQNRKKLSNSERLILNTPLISKNYCEENIANLEIGVVKLYDRRAELRAKELRVETLRKKGKKVLSRIRKMEDLLGEEYKELRQERNSKLIDLLDKMKD